MSNVKNHAPHVDGSNIAFLLFLAFRTDAPAAAARTASGERWSKYSHGRDRPGSHAQLETDVSGPPFILQPQELERVKAFASFSVRVSKHLL